ncbi:MAG TPA: DoxX family protein [Chitinophagaceae bacterium]|jgi:uncharacterized membrane protein YphA (DoxX/SURF4 family)|nr:DoxX family protein [Chitinophagaceae bacterium]
MKKQQYPSKGWNRVLWVAQSILALMFLAAGTMKLTLPMEKLAEILPWAAQMPEAAVRLIGLSEFSGAIGLVLPSFFRIRPKLTPIAAVGLALMQLFALLFHISRGETPVIGMNVVLFIIAVFIAWGRFQKAPISPKRTLKLGKRVMS